MHPLATTSSCCARTHTPNPLPQHALPRALPCSGLSCAVLCPAVLFCAGKQLLSLWDALCQLLRARQVSVEDVSNKSGMLLRVLHTAAYGTTW